MSKYRIKNEQELLADGWFSFGAFWSNHNNYYRGFQLPSVDVGKVVNIIQISSNGEMRDDNSYRWPRGLIVLERTPLFDSVDSLATLYGYYPEANKQCTHSFVNMSFMHVKMVCKTCNKEQ